MLTDSPNISSIRERFRLKASLDAFGPFSVIEKNKEVIQPQVPLRLPCVSDSEMISG